MLTAPQARRLPPIGPAQPVGEPEAAPRPTLPPCSRVPSPAASTGRSTPRCRRGGRGCGSPAPSRRARRRRSFGARRWARSWSFPTAVLYGERHIRAGRGTTINTWVTLAAGYHPTQPGLPETVLSIGDRSLIGMRCGIVAHESVTIGDDVLVRPEVYVTDGNHGYTGIRPRRPATSSGPPAGGDRRDGCWLGHGTAVLAGTHLGRHVVVAAGSVVTGTFSTTR
ncbi:MAG: acyltransferase [Acidimicrobiales bacterium]